MEKGYNLEDLVHNELKADVFVNDKVDDLFKHMQGDKKQARTGEGFYPSGTKKLQGIQDSHRGEFLTLFTDYI